MSSLPWGGNHDPADVSAPHSGWVDISTPPLTPHNAQQGGETDGVLGGRLSGTLQNSGLPSAGTSEIQHSQCNWTPTAACPVGITANGGVPRSDNNTERNMSLPSWASSDGCVELTGPCAACHYLMSNEKSVVLKMVFHLVAYRFVPDRTCTQYAAICTRCMEEYQEAPRFVSPNYDSCYSCGAILGIHFPARVRLFAVATIDKCQDLKKTHTLELCGNCYNRQLWPPWDPFRIPRACPGPPPGPPPGWSPRQSPDDPPTHTHETTLESSPEPVPGAPPGPTPDPPPGPPPGWSVSSPPGPPPGWPVRLPPPPPPGPPPGWPPRHPPGTWNPCKICNEALFPRCVCHIIR